MTEIIYVNREELVSERRELVRQAMKWTAKLVSLNSLYNGRLRKIEKKLAALEKLLGEE